MREQKPAAANQEVRLPPLWIYKGMAVRAWTKSEARAILKGKLGKLPIGAGRQIVKGKE